MELVGAGLLTVSIIVLDCMEMTRFAIEKLIKVSRRIKKFYSREGELDLGALAAALYRWRGMIRDMYNIIQRMRRWATDRNVPTRKQKFCTYLLLGGLRTVGRRRELAVMTSRHRGMNRSDSLRQTGVTHIWYGVVCVSSEINNVMWKNGFLFTWGFIRSWLDK